MTQRVGEYWRVLIRGHVVLIAFGDDGTAELQFDDYPVIAVQSAWASRWIGNPTWVSLSRILIKKGIQRPAGGILVTNKV